MQHSSCSSPRPELVTWPHTSTVARAQVPPALLSLAAPPPRVTNPCVQAFYPPWGLPYPPDPASTWLQHDSHFAEDKVGPSSHQDEDGTLRPESSTSPASAGPPPNVRAVVLGHGPASDITPQGAEPRPCPLLTPPSFPRHLPKAVTEEGQEPALTTRGAGTGLGRRQGHGWPSVCPQAQVSHPTKMRAHASVSSASTGRSEKMLTLTQARTPRSPTHARMHTTHARPGPEQRPTYQDAVERRGGPSPLHMAQHSHTRVKAQPLDHQLLTGTESGVSLGSMPTPMAPPPHGPQPWSSPRPRPASGMPAPQSPTEPAQGSRPQL